jgi:hypothetical protein
MGWWCERCKTDHELLVCPRGLRTGCGEQSESRITPPAMRLCAGDRAGKRGLRIRPASSGAHHQRRS